MIGLACVHWGNLALRVEFDPCLRQSLSQKGRGKAGHAAKKKKTPRAPRKYRQLMMTARVDASMPWTRHGQTNPLYSAAPGNIVRPPCDISQRSRRCILATFVGDAGCALDRSIPCTHPIIDAFALTDRLARGSQGQQGRELEQFPVPKQSAARVKCKIVNADMIDTLSASCK